MASSPQVLSSDTYVKMHRELHLPRENDNGSCRLAEAWSEVFQWMDLCAAISACKLAKRGKLVTAQVDDMRLLESLQYGDMLTVTGSVSCAWNTSMEVEVKLEAENLLKESQPRHICTSYFTFVVLKNLDGSRPDPLPKLIPSCKEDHKKYLEASERRRIRFQRKDLIKSTSNIFNSKAIGVVGNMELSLQETQNENVQVKLMSESAVCSSLIVLPPNANPHGNTFGGQIMGWMEETARLACKKHSRRNMYLWHVDDIQFIQPSTVGDCLTIKAQVNRVYKDTLEVGVRVEAFSFMGAGAEEARHINSGYLTYGSYPPSEQNLNRSLDSDQLCYNQLPLVKPTNERELKQFNDALGRRRIRMERRTVSGCAVQSFTPEWSPVITAELILSNVTNILKVALELPISWWEVKQESGFKLFVHDAEEVTLCKLEMFLPAGPNRPSASELFPMFIDANLRKQWDTTFKGYEVIEKIDASNDIVHATFGSDSGDFDLCLLRSWRAPEHPIVNKNDEQLFIVSSRSIIHPKVPENEGVKRGYVLPSGFIISNLPDQSGIQIVYVIQVGASALQFTLDSGITSYVSNFETLRTWYETQGS